MVCCGKTLTGSASLIGLIAEAGVAEGNLRSLSRGKPGRPEEIVGVDRAETRWARTFFTYRDLRCRFHRRNRSDGGGWGKGTIGLLCIHEWDRETTSG